MDVGSWLRGLGLGQYESAFVENAIDTDVLSELTEDDLQKLQIRLGERRRLLKAIKSIQAAVGGSPSAPITSEAVETVLGSSFPAGRRRHLTLMISGLGGWPG